MNTITFNDGLKKVFAANKNDSCLPGKCFNEIIESPLIDWAEDTTDAFFEADHPYAFFQSKCPRLPFNRFRVNGFYRFGSGEHNRFRAWVWHDAVDAGVDPCGYNCCFELLEGFENGVMYRGINRMVAAKMILMPHEKKKLVWAYSVFNTKDGRAARADLSEETMWQACAEWVNKLTIDFHNPHLHLCVRHPRVPQGKSVSWIKAREHYVLIHKSHPANRSDVKAGSSVSSGNEIERAAHSRRAHYRMLRSPKFKNKVGQRIWVRSTWVGPKEWTDHSGQVYRLIR